MKQEFLVVILEARHFSDGRFTVNIGLYNNTHWQIFPSKINYQDFKVFNFFCDCSDRNIWQNRIKERLNNPTPNQYFKSVEQAESHYDYNNMKLLENEYYIDSCDDLEENLVYIRKIINKG